ncbi:hypothetical protein [Streptomyces sp. NBC_01233]|uniref:hypothetical protein n=1 Tax=Streptomyces sp. NBC_01233 TaxID=2903787 RepID=UPI002E128D07|nr:V-type ATPase subunit [Streptomyces sp. NBC_01233]
MGAGWVAGVIRARALVSRCAGASAGRELAACATLGEALRSLATTPYGRGLHAESELADVQRAVSATLLWQLRVLAGWLPRAGADMLRPLSAGFEIANVEARLRSFSGAPEPAPYRLGTLGTAWRRLQHAGTPAELRSALASSLWGDPGADTPWAVLTTLRMAAADRVCVTVGPARHWAVGRAALLTAREHFVCGRPLPGPARKHAVRLLGSRAVDATDFGDFRRHLPATAHWAADGVADPHELWRAEARWWQALADDGAGLLRSPRHGPAPVVGAVAVLSADAWRVRAGLELAARGGGSLEVLDANV